MDHLTFAAFVLMAGATFLLAFCLARLCLAGFVRILLRR